MTNTYLGDYPQYAPGEGKAPLDKSAGWMLLTYKKTAEASSTLVEKPRGKYTFETDRAFDEDIRTWWSAATGNAGEWLKVDMGKVCRLEAVQVNFADQGCTQFGPLPDGDAYRYYLEVSVDGQAWTTAVDRKANQQDRTHDYVQLDQPIMTRYARLVNVYTPPGCGLFSVSGLRLFGSGLGEAPARVSDITVERSAEDRRGVKVSWAPVANADFYIIRYGIAPDRLFENQQVYEATHLEWYSLNAGTPYYFTVDAVNDTSVTKGTQIVRTP